VADAWLAAADVVVAPSRYEGMALVPLEAMARARSVVASDIPANRESVPIGAGAAVDAQDPAALATAVADRLSDSFLVEREGRAGRVYVQARHDARVASERLVGLYADVLTPTMRSVRVD
jgi:glycosyltransferase involved in cell wall biosynthesis